MTADVTRFADTTFFGDAIFFQDYVDLAADNLRTGAPRVGSPEAIIFSILEASNLSTGRPYFSPVLFALQESYRIKIAFFLETISNLGYTMPNEQVDLLLRSSNMGDFFMEPDQVDMVMTVSESLEYLIPYDMVEMLLEVQQEVFMGGT